MKEELKKIIKFLFTGGVATAIDFVIYFVVSQWINVTLAKTISMCLSCTYSYCINKAWTFRVKEKTNKAYVMKYVFSQVVNIVVNVVSNTIIYNMTEKKFIAYILATGIAMVCNYILQRFFVFRKGEA